MKKTEYLGGVKTHKYKWVNDYLKPWIDSKPTSYWKEHPEEYQKWDFLIQTAIEELRMLRMLNDENKLEKL